jgi:hypothetical protein
MGVSERLVEKSKPFSKGCVNTYKSETLINKGFQEPTKHNSKSTGTMKTKLYLSFILSTTIGMMVNGQNTLVNHNSSNNAYTASNTPKKFLATLGSTAEPLAILTPAETAPTMAPSPQLHAFLSQQADDYISMAISLRNIAKTKSGSERLQIIAEAVVYEKKAEGSQLSAIEMAGTLNLRAFKENRTKLRFMVSNLRTGELIPNQTSELIYASEKNMKLAIELREEAHAIVQTASRLGTLTNAEEKELLALSEQTQAIQQLEPLQKSKSF